VGAAQLGPIALKESRSDVVVRLIALMRQARDAGCDLVVYPELALTTFFPRWYEEDRSSMDRFCETEMPGPATQPLFDEARRLNIGFALGYAELTAPDASGVRHRFNTSIIVDKTGAIVAK